MSILKFVNSTNNSFQIFQPYSLAGDQAIAVEELTKGLKKGLRYQTLVGVTGSGKTYTMANIIAKLDRTSIIIVPNKILAAQIYSEMKYFFPKNSVEYFVSYYDYYQPEAYVPSKDLFIEKDSSINKHIEQMRLSATKSLIERRDTIIVSTVSCIYGIGSHPSEYLKMVLFLEKGSSISYKEILSNLISMQYHRDDYSNLSRGSFRVCGDIIDIFPSENRDFGIRIHLFDDQIEKIQSFDPLTGKVFEDLNHYKIYPNSHYSVSRHRILRAVESIKLELCKRLKVLKKNGYFAEAERLEQRTIFDLELLQETGSCKGIENYSWHLSGLKPGEAPITLIDYLPSDTIMFIDESHITIPQLVGMFRGNLSRKDTLVNYGFRLPSALDNRPLNFEEFKTRMPQCIFVSATPSNYEINIAENIVEQIIRPTGLLDPLIEIRPVCNQIDDIMNEIKKNILVNERVIVTTLTKRMSESITMFLSENGIKIRYMHSDTNSLERAEILRDFRLGTFDVLIGINLLREGLDVPEVSLVAILDADQEGFLRSENSLIQTIGRAARHLNGRAILYANHITKSIQNTINETNRRREKQLIFNMNNSIIPKSIFTTVKELLIHEKQNSSTKFNKNKIKTLLSQSLPSDVKNLNREIKRLEKLMSECSKNLEFEKAALVRNALIQLKQQVL
ncbi:MAG: excinuclease ABC subunit UvrB [Bordetella sp.]|nr:MAG: excinuclease ABC subunit UvrB [Bordetella sp.]